MSPLAAVRVHHAILYIKSGLSCHVNSLSSMAYMTAVYAPLATLHDVASISCNILYNCTIMKCLVKGSIVSDTFLTNPRAS